MAKTGDSNTQYMVVSRAVRYCYRAFLALLLPGIATGTGIESRAHRQVERGFRHCAGYPVCGREIDLACRLGRFAYLGWLGCYHHVLDGQEIDSDSILLKRISHISAVGIEMHIECDLFF
jgi:hypothetical protein